MCDAITYYTGEQTQEYKAQRHCGWAVADLQAKIHKAESCLQCLWDGLQNDPCLLCLRFVEIKFQFSHLLPQLGVHQLLEDVVSKDTDECYKCYGDRGVPNHKLVSS